MANTKISALTNGNPAQAGDALPIARGGANFQVTAASVAALALPISFPNLPDSANPPTSFQSGITSINAFGDSITSGLGLAVPLQQVWAYLFAHSLGLPINNHANSGAQMSDVAGQAYLLSPSLAAASIGIFGSNDIASGWNPALVTAGYECFATWMGLLNASKITLAAGITLVGSWGLFTEFNLQGATSTTLGDTATGTVNGTVVYVGMWTDSGVTDHFDILVDGISTGPYTNTSVGGIEPTMIRIGGLAPGNHTVQVKVITGGDTATIQWMGGNGGGGPFPVVYFGNSIPRQVQDPTAQNASFAAMLSTLAGDGLNVHLINDFTALTKTQVPTVYQGDITHLNTLGNWIMATFWLNQFYSPLAFPAKTGVNGDALAQILNLGGITPEVLVAAIQMLLNTPGAP